jgi:hypothetical protein
MFQITFMATKINYELISGPTQVDIVHGTTSITSVIVYLHFLLSTVYKWTLMRGKEHNFTTKQNTVTIKSTAFLDPWNSISGERNFIYSTAFRLPLGLNQPHIQLVPWSLSVAVKRQVCEADNSPPTSAEVKNGGAIPLLFPYVFIAWCLFN